MTPDIIILLTAIFAATACGLIGSFLVLRQNAMLGDAISHAVLPGLVLAFLITGSRDVMPMLIGAGLVGLLTAFLTEMLDKTGRIYKDAALGIVFTFLFAVGVILVSMYTDQIDLDQECVLYGEITFTPWDKLVIFGNDIGPRAMIVLGSIFIINLLFIGLFYKQLKISSFDSQFAVSMGISAKKWHYLLMMMVSLTVVAAFEAVGAILVVAMLILPGATAYLITERLPVMLVLSVFIGIFTAVGGFYTADLINASISGCISVVGGIIFFIVLLSRNLFHLRI